MLDALKEAICCPKAGVFLVKSKHDICEAAIHYAWQKNIGARIVRGECSKSKTGLFSEWSAAMQFPVYFGKNWDALEDCLTHIHRQHYNETGFLLCVADAPLILVDEPSPELSVFLNIIEAVLRLYREGSSCEQVPSVDPYPLKLVFQASEELYQEFSMGAWAEFVRRVKAESFMLGSKV